MSFKVGDKVIAANTLGRGGGYRGTIIRVSMTGGIGFKYCVDWDDKIYGPVDGYRDRHLSPIPILEQILNLAESL